MPHQRTCIGVVFGGASGEHLVSIKSAKAVIGALQEGENINLFEIILIYIDLKGRWWPTATAKEVLEKGSPPETSGLEKDSLIKGFTGLPAGSEKVEIWKRLIIFSI